MPEWKDLKERRSQLWTQIISRLTTDQRDILTKVLELEFEGRHLKRPRIKEPLRDFIEQVIR